MKKCWFVTGRMRKKKENEKERMLSEKGERRKRESLVLLT